ncbi:hypothetical protein [Paenibacillus sp. J2TS4]|uniref:hypothetical protein n=1 Tax=Paenibacillus sp. J2TS4 TaxID=2807194 RepID=UPI001B103391|nr:hypothetical protein [Paenibacillus sp. J2TS4]GIP35045.1 hypothetical protein J2TS4_42550 [Paenibacillus sp. J2TS4]
MNTDGDPKQQRGQGMLFQGETDYHRTESLDEVNLGREGHGEIPATFTGRRVRLGQCGVG